MDLFDYRERYPDAPGFKRPGTSERAAADMRGRAPTLRERALQAIKLAPGGLTADEVAALIGATVLAVRPRITELSLDGKIVDTGRERPNASGKKAIVWEAV